MIRNAQTESKVCGSESGLQTEDKGAIASDKEGHTASANVITARRTKDGYIKFDVKISHIIEQTLLRSLKRPNFRKSTIKVLPGFVESDEEDGGDNSVQVNGCGKTVVPMATMDKVNDPALLRQQRKWLKRPHSILHSDSSPYLSSQNEEKFKRLMLDSLTTEPPDKSSMGLIPANWLKAQITEQERSLFQHSIRNASLSPHEVKRRQKVKRKDDELERRLGADVLKTDIKWPSNPIGGIPKKSTKVDIPTSVNGAPNPQ